MSKKSKKSNKNNNHKKNNNQYNKYKTNKSQVNIKSNNQKKSIPNKPTPKKEFDLDKFISDTKIEPPVSTYKNYNHDSDFGLDYDKRNADSEFVLDYDKRNDDSEFVLDYDKKNDDSEVDLDDDKKNGNDSEVESDDYKKYDNNSEFELDDDKKYDNDSSDSLDDNRNYNNDSYFDLDDNKKLDIDQIFDESPNSIPKNKINKWKIISFILLILLIIVMFFAIDLKNNSIRECNEPKKEEPKQEEIVEPTPQHEQYLFLGDSLFEQYNTYEFFRGYDTINTGISGITAEEMYDALDERLYQYNPTTIFVLLGTNDLYKGYNADETFEHITKLVDKIHEDRPELKINILSLLPINQTDDPKVNQSSNVNKSNEMIDEINKNVEDYCKKNSFTYINVHDTLLDDEGNLKLSYTIEGLHLLDLGYHQMTMELLKYMQK